MKKTIEDIIINKIQSGSTFDSHKIIDIFIKNYNNLYSKLSKKYKTVNSFHSVIGQTIKTFAPQLITDIGKSYSLNIHGKNSKCHVYKK